MFRFAVAIFYVNETEILAITDHMKMFTFLRNMPSQLVDEERFCQVRNLLYSSIFYTVLPGGAGWTRAYLSRASCGMLSPGHIFLELLVACYQRLNVFLGCLPNREPVPNAKDYVIATTTSCCAEGMTSFPGLYVTSLNVKYNFHAGGT
jgi:hypothetical protein